MSWITTHHEDCDGDDCQHFDCASLPENIGQWREGQVVSVDPDGSVEIEWTDGTRSKLMRKRPTALEVWAKSVEKGGRCSDKLCKCNDPSEPKSKED